jgi:hypothetical protein
MGVVTDTVQRARDTRRCHEGSASRSGCHVGATAAYPMVSAGDTVVTAEASRPLAQDSVTSPLRAPFTRYAEAAGEANLTESGRRHLHVAGSRTNDD